MNRTMLVFIYMIFILSCNRNEKQNSPKVFFSEDKRKVMAIKYFKDSLLDAECFWFYPNGNLKQKSQFVNGKANGHAYFFL